MVVVADDVLLFLGLVEISCFLVFFCVVSPSHGLFLVPFVLSNFLGVLSLFSVVIGFCCFSVYAIGCKCFLLGAVVIVLFVLVYLVLVFLCLGSFIFPVYLFFLFLYDPFYHQRLLKSYFLLQDISEVYNKVQALLY